MASVPAVGIDLGTTYSSIAWLNEQSEPVTIPNLEGDSSTPSVVMYLEGREVVGEEALHNAIEHPERVIQGAKRFLADPRKSWTIDGKTITPVDVSTAIVRKLLGDARAQIGPVHRAVITVPAQFSERQRLATIEAGQRAGLRQVDLINEPVAAALCYVLGAEGLWFSQLAEDQRILVYDLGGGTFDLSLVSYQQDRVQVLASTGDLHLGGMDWNQRLLSTIAEQFQREMQEDPRTNVRSLQRLHREVERCKRELSRQTRSTLVVEHAGHRKSYQIERSQFDQLTADLLERTRQITQGLINQHRAGSSHLDVTIVSTGGSSRMPMIDTMLKSIRGTTHSKALSPDQSIAHGAAYFAGMLLSNSPDVGRFAGSSTGQRLARFTQSSVNARSLGLLIRDVDSGERVPFYLIPQNTPLPATAAKTFGTVHPDQRRVTLSIVESGANPDDPHSAIGVCSIDELPPGLPAESPIEVSISYDGSARVSVAARELTSGKAVRVELTRETPGATPAAPEEDVGTPTGQPTPTASMATRAPAPPPRTVTSPGPTPTPTVAPAPAVAPASPPRRVTPAAQAPGPGNSGWSPAELALCPRCAGPLDARGNCPDCRQPATLPPAGTGPQPQRPPVPRPVPTPSPGSNPRPVPGPAAANPPATPTSPPAPKSVPTPATLKPRPVPPAPVRGTVPPTKPAPPPTPTSPPSSSPTPGAGHDDPGEDEFWKYVEQR